MPPRRRAGQGLNAFFAFTVCGALLVPWPAVPPLLSRGRTNPVTIGGHGIAGPVFRDNREYRKWAFNVWQAECLDMESTAIAQVCWANRVPFLIVRPLSDLAGGQDGVNDADATEVRSRATPHACWPRCCGRCRRPDPGLGRVQDWLPNRLVVTAT